jgi:hypothetical protein
MLIGSLVGWLSLDVGILGHMGYLCMCVVTTIGMVMLLWDFEARLLSICWLVGHHLL